MRRIADLMPGRTRADDENGLTIVELLVAMMVFGILLALVGTLYATSQRVVAAASVASSDTGVASNVMNELTSVLRYGAVLPDPSDGQDTVPAFVTATETSLVLYSYANTSSGKDSTVTPQPVMVGFFLGADGGMTEKRWNFQGSAVPDAATVANVAPDSTVHLGGPLIAPTTGNPPAGVCQDPNATAAPTPPASVAGPSDVPALFTFCDSNAPIAFSSGSIPAADFDDISSVVVNISMNTGASRGDRAVVLAGTIELQNLGGKSEVS